MVSPCDAVAVSTSHVADTINQDRPKRFVACGKCFSCKVHTFFKELTIFLTERS